MLYEIHNELPPTKKIQHAIDFIPESQGPNLPHHKILNELNRQIEYFLFKGFFKHRLSSYVVHVLLTSKKKWNMENVIDSLVIEKITI